VFVGKSLFRSEGQNPLEAAAAGAWVVTGPGMNNFRQIMQDLRAAHAVTEVKGAAGLEQVLSQSLNDAVGTAELGKRAQAWVEACRGSLKRSAGLLEELLGSGWESG
jgi:3-deoxy-D-manno-octulosonic-acid transferase